jgi:hypothetical protein
MKNKYGQRIVNALLAAVIVFFGTSFFSASLTFAVLRWFGWRKAESASDEFDDDSFRKAMQRSFLPRYFILLE